MKHLPNIAGALLGLLFITFASVYFFDLMKMPPPPEGSPAAHFMSAFGPTGYMRFVKCCELLGGLLVAIPRTRNFGLLILCPIIVNIIVYHICLTSISNLADPVLIVICGLTAYLLWAGRKKFAQLLG
jgi:putative oxidoreductase